MSIRFLLRKSISPSLQEPVAVTLTYLPAVPYAGPRITAPAKSVFLLLESGVALQLGFDPQNVADGTSHCETSQPHSFHFHPLGPGVSPYWKPRAAPPTMGDQRETPNTTPPRISLTGEWTIVNTQPPTSYCGHKMTRGMMNRRIIKQNPAGLTQPAARVGRCLTPLCPSRLVTQR